MSLLSKFTAFIKDENLFQPKDKLLLAVSGGVDSVVLCELCFRAGFDFVIAHCNFQLRGEESKRDEEFVGSLEKKYGKHLLVKKFDTHSYVEQKKVSVQVAARELRYEWFTSLVDQENELSLAFVATAHHQDDNIETVVMNFFKGTGIAGLRGILPATGKIVRPLLFARKEEILEFASESQLAYVEDSSNQTEKYTRNFIRLQVLPLIQQQYPQAAENIINNISRFRNIEILYNESIQAYKKNLIEKKGDEFHIPVGKLKKVRALLSVIHDIAKEFGFTTAQGKEIIQLLDSGTGRFINSATHRILKNREWLIISKLDNSDGGIVVVENLDQQIRFPGGELKLEVISNSPEFKLTSHSSIACLDASEIKPPLILRKWRPGDYFYPLGMRKKKKLARFFIDEKLSKNEKENVWVLEMDKKIIWVLGKRIDDRFKWSSSSERILKVELKAL